VFVGNPDSTVVEERERTRRGQLRIDGLTLWTLEAPGPGSRSRSTGLWLTRYGSLADSPTETGNTLASDLASDAVGWWLFFSDLNTFGYVAGRTAAFNWL
jgi:hypothetical protein